MKKFFKQKAFTLAEILITLGVIGVITAIIIPNLITKYYKTATVHRLKENYATMQSIIRKSIEDNGDLDSWDYTLSDEEFTKTFFLPYFNSATKLKNPYKIHTLPPKNGTRANNSSNTGYAYKNWWGQPSLRYALNDGTILGISIHYNMQCSAKLFIYLNGYNKPNMLGRDVFVYKISGKIPRIFDFGQYCMRSTCSTALRSRTWLTRTNVEND
jgi:prepilin-type N-terminal cleavage/methylation domain-containing protein